MASGASVKVIISLVYKQHRGIQEELKCRDVDAKKEKNPNVLN